MSNIKELRKIFKFHNFGIIYCASALTKHGCQDAFRKKFANNSKIVFKKLCMYLLGKVNQLVTTTWIPPTEHLALFQRSQN